MTSDRLIGLTIKRETKGREKRLNFYTIDVAMQPTDSSRKMFVTTPALRERLRKLKLKPRTNIGTVQVVIDNYYGQIIGYYYTPFQSLEDPITGKRTNYEGHLAHIGVGNLIDLLISKEMHATNPEYRNYQVVDLRDFESGGPSKARKRQSTDRRGKGYWGIGTKEVSLTEEVRLAKEQVIRNYNKNKDSIRTIIQKEKKLKERFQRRFRRPVH